MKRKQGRPPKPAAQRQSVAMIAMVTPRESKIIRAAAKKYASISEFLRTAALKLAREAEK